jgi:hypothetical protein
MKQMFSVCCAVACIAGLAHRQQPRPEIALPQTNKAREEVYARLRADLQSHDQGRATAAVADARSLAMKQSEVIRVLLDANRYPEAETLWD